VKFPSALSKPSWLGHGKRYFIFYLKDPESEGVLIFLNEYVANYYSA
jgi:hypothetical protein